MTEPSKPHSPPNPEITVSMTDVVKFVRQLGHDLRNHLNAVELQTAYLAELADPSLKEEIKRLRGMISELGATLQSVTATLSAVKPTLMQYRAGDFMEDLRWALSEAYPDEEGKTQWDIDAGEAYLEIDPQLMQSAFLELFANAFRHDRADGAVAARTTIENNYFTFTLREPKRSFEMPTENWGREPFCTVKHGHYGLGLHRARAIIEAHFGRLSARYDSSTSSLITTVALPLAANANG